MVKLLALAMMITLFIPENLMVFAKEEEKYKYAITVESDDWFDYSVLEKNKMLEIDNQTTSEMSDEELVRAIADYPYLIDIYVCDTMDEGLKQFGETCNAFCVLMKRQSGAEAFIKYSKIIINEMKEKPRSDGRTEFVSIALSDISKQLEKSIETVMTCYTSLSAPTTPNGSSVSYITPSENHTTAYHATLDNEVVSTYGVTLVRNGSCKYNCHSYAWHSTSSGNIYWINNPSVYMTDGSYKRKYSGSVSSSIYSLGLSVNDRIYYASNTHSAYFIDNPLNGAPLATLKAKSKWGQLGVFEHTVTNVPSSYSYSTVTIWHR